MVWIDDVVAFLELAHGRLYELESLLLYRFLHCYLGDICLLS